MKGEPVITCVVADDHPALVEAVCLLLAAEGVEVVATATDGEKALRLIEQHEPEVAVLDLIMPRLSGIEIARAAGRSSPRTAIILYTGHAERELLGEALHAGVRGFVLKEGPLTDLVHAVVLAADGQIYVDPVLAPTLVRGSATRPGPGLSSRERDILRLLAAGRSNDEIAETLYISADTVRTYLRRAMKKLDAETRTQAVAIAVRESLIA
jgi:two-component system nitrate/nitrite response regulator NarL